MRRILLAIVLAGAMCSGLAACGLGETPGASSQDAQESESDEALQGVVLYDVDAFELDGWSVEITDAEIVFDESSGKDDLIVYLTAKNGNSEAGSFAGVANIFAYQGDAELRQANAMKDDGEFYLNLDPFNELVEPEKEIELMYGWELEGYDTLEVIFTGFYEGVERNVVHFDVSNCQTDEAAAVAAGALDGVDAKHAAKGAKLEGVQLEVVEPWFLDSSDDTHAELRQDDSPAQLSVVVSDEQESAEAWANRIRENYTEGSDVSTVRVGVNTFYCFYPTETQFQLFADCPGGGRAVNIRGMFLTLEEATAQIESIALLDTDEGEEGEGEAEDGATSSGEDEAAQGEASDTTSDGTAASDASQAAEPSASDGSVDANGMGAINDVGVEGGSYDDVGTNGGYAAGDYGSADVYYDETYY